LAANSCLYIAYAVDQASRFSINPQNTHALVIKWILLLEKYANKGTATNTRK